MTLTMGRHEEERLQPWALSPPVCESNKDFTVEVWSYQGPLMSVAKIKTSGICSYRDPQSLAHEVKLDLSKFAQHSCRLSPVYYSNYGR